MLYLGFMSEPPSQPQPASKKTGFVCAQEAQLLLNCVASKKYSQAECVQLLDRLRICCEKNVRAGSEGVFVRPRAKECSTCGGLLGSTVD